MMDTVRIYYFPIWFKFLTLWINYYALVRFKSNTVLSKWYALTNWIIKRVALNLYHLRVVHILFINEIGRNCSFFLWGVNSLERKVRIWEGTQLISCGEDKVIDSEFGLHRDVRVVGRGQGYMRLSDDVHCSIICLHSHWCPWENKSSTSLSRMFRAA